MENQIAVKFALILILMAGSVAIASETKGIAEYIGSDACQVCHSEKHNAWKSSQHANTLNANNSNPTWTRNGIGCEACHGPGSDHVSGQGDASKIISSKDADICGQCHSGTRSGRDIWTEGYQPGVQLSSLKGFQLISVDPDKLPPEPGPNQRLSYNMWLASGHSQALSDMRNSGQESVDCYGCHSAEGFAAKRQGETIDLAQKNNFHSLTCVLCHDPHGSDNPRQLVLEPEELCSSCHSQRAVLQGKGAKGIEDTRSFHSAVECYSCHMTEGNHLMKILRPDDPNLPENRTDTCTACHKDNNRKARAKQLPDWQAWYKETMDPIQTDLKAIDAALKENPDLLNDTLKAKLNDVRGNLAIIIWDRSRGAHNLDYALEIMALAATDLKEIKAVFSIQ
jgi:predicted CXXCH cytochrome family protein